MSLKNVKQVASITPKKMYDKDQTEYLTQTLHMTWDTYVKAAVSTGQSVS